MRGYRGAGQISGWFTSRLLRSLLLVAIVASVGLVSACGGDDETAATEPAASTEAPATSETAQTGAPTETAAPAETGAPAEGAAQAAVVTDYLAYTGGTDGPADDSIEPVAVGWVNQQGGTEDLGLKGTEGAQVAVDYINDHLGGIQGHPLELHTCFIANAEEEGQTCAQQLANDGDVAIIAMGGVAIGAQSFYATLDQAKPVTLPVSLSGVDAAQENTFILFGAIQPIFGPWGTFGRDVLHAKTAAVLYPDIAVVSQSADTAADAMELAGIEVTKVAYPPNATDLLGPITAAGAESADMFVPLPDARGCINIAKALEQIGSDATVVSSPVCLDGQVIEGLGGDLPKWIYGIAASLTGDVSYPDVAAEVEVLKEYGKEDLAGDVQVQIAFSEMLVLARLMNEVGADNITPETMSAALKEFKGPVPMGPPAVECGKYPAAPASCNDLTNFFQYEGNFKFTQVAEWLPPPEGFTF